MHEWTDADSLNAILEQVGWSSAELARRLGVSRPLVHFWTSGKQRVPAAVMAWLNEVSLAVATLPKPPKWRRYGGRRRRDESTAA